MVSARTGGRRTRTVSDGGRAIQEALRTTKAISTHQRDVWHLLHLAGQVQARLERVVQEEEERWRLIERQEQQRATTGKKAAGRPAKTTADEQEQLLSQLHRVRDGVRYLFAQLRQLLEIVVLSEAARATSALLPVTPWRSGDGAGLAGGSRAVRSGDGAKRGAAGQQAGPAGSACPAALCGGDGSESTRGHCAVGRT